MLPPRNDVQELFLMQEVLVLLHVSPAFASCYAVISPLNV